MQTRRTFTKALAGLGLCGSLLAGVVAGPRLCHAADPAPKEGDVKKMQAALPDKAPAKPEKARKVLVFGNAQGFVHGSIPLGCETVKQLGEKTGGWASTISYDPAAFDNLKDYDAVVLVSTTGNFLIPRIEVKDPGKAATDDQKKEFEAKKKEAEEKLKPYKDAEKGRMQNLLDFVEKDGKGLMGIHAATDAYYGNRAYGELSGGYFNGHPWNEKVGVKVDDPKSPLTEMFDKNGIDVADEIYQFTPKGKDGKDQTYSREKLHVLLSLDYTTPGRTAQKGKSPDNDFGVAWIRQAGKGRAAYCSLGHREEIYWNSTILKFYVAEIQYALGDLKADATPSAAKPTAAAK